MIITPIPHATFLHTNDIWSFQLNLLSINTPRNFDLLTSAMASPSIWRDIPGRGLLLAEKHMKCVFFIFDDNLLTLSHSAMIAKSLLTPSWRLMALEPLKNRLVSSANNTGSVLLHTIQRSLYRSKRARNLKSILVVPHTLSSVD